MMRWGVLLLALWLLAGCSQGTVDGEPEASDAPPAPVMDAIAPPGAPDRLVITPASGPPGTEVTVQIRLEHPEDAWTSGTGKPWNVQLCWDRCGPRALARTIWPKPSAEDPHLFTSTARVPAYTDGRRLREGPLEVMLACATDYDDGCTQRPEATAAFQLTGELPGVDWASLPAGLEQPIPSLVARPGRVINPANPAHQVECEGGAVVDTMPQPPPRLRITKDGGANWEEISLLGVRLGQMAGMAGCRTLALDPSQIDTYYLAGTGHTAAAEEGAFPLPLFTADRGVTWQPVPAPPGFERPEMFLRFTVTEAEVIAWYGRQADVEQPPEVVGLATSDGGATWHPVALGCPADGACLWEVRDPIYGRVSRRLMRSEDGGANWRWAEWVGEPVTVLTARFRLIDGGIEAIGQQSLDRGLVPLLRSEGGGATWVWVDLPEPPGGWQRGTALMAGPEGSLLLLTEAKTLRLDRGQGDWVIEPS